MSDTVVKDAEAAVKSAVASEAVRAESKVVAFVRANALKAIGVSAVLGLVVGHFVI